MPRGSRSAKSSVPIGPSTSRNAAALLRHKKGAVKTSKRGDRLARIEEETAVKSMTPEIRPVTLSDSRASCPLG